MQISFKFPERTTSNKAISKAYHLSDCFVNEISEVQAADVIQWKLTKSSSFFLSLTKDFWIASWTTNYSNDHWYGLRYILCIATIQLNFKCK